MLKNKFSLSQIVGITVSKVTDEFVIHCKDEENDYNYISYKRIEILDTLNKAYHNIENKNIKLSEINDKSLKTYVTLKKEKQNDPSYTRMKNDQLIEIETYIKNNNNEKSNGLETGAQPASSREMINGRKGTLTMFSSHRTVKEVNLEDFKILKVIGRGSFGKVCLVEYLPTHEIYAMKSLKKDILIEEDQIESTILEKEILQSIDHPLLCRLIFCFQTEDRIFFVMPFLSGGELFQHLRKFKTFSEEMVKFYGAQIAIALQYLHDKNIVYRDLKPENILMNDKGYLCLADFGMAKKLKDDEKALSFCGTPEYLAPEIITGEGHDKNVDWWSLGIILYEMLCGIPPFYVENLDKMYDLIKYEEVSFPKDVYLSEEAKDIIRKLLAKEVTDRLGYKTGLEEVKKHPFFNGLDFDLIEQQKVPAPFIPQIDNNTDVQNFDAVFTNEDVGMSYIPKRNMEVIKANQYKFDDFSH